VERRFIEFDLMDMFKRIIYKIAYPIARLYWFIFRPLSFGVKCVVECDGQILLVKNSYTRTNQWTFPGGGIKNNEDRITAVKREIKEETGIILSNPKYLGNFFTEQEYKRDTVYVFSETVPNKDIKTETSEILEAKWFNKNELPPILSPSVSKVLKIYFDNNVTEK
jgi:ADP-ribose pyrophosphatase YjhB (NUDIX family)